MQLIYSTSELSQAERLSQLLAGAEVETYISNADSAQMPGFSARLTPGFVGVWLLRYSDLSTAQDVMQSNGFMVPSRVEIAMRKTNGNRWLAVGIAAFVIAVIVVLVASGF
jgi:hypothetical protein